jgi:exodeoxyribonuclease VII small subunit
VSKKEKETKAVYGAPETLHFEDALKRLEEIVARLEKGELALEDSLKLYEEGVKLSRHCHAKLEEAEGKIEMLLKDAKGDAQVDGAGRPKTTPFTPKDDETPF